MKFNIGDHVAMPGVPIVVEVLEFGICWEDQECSLGASTTFRFKDPQTGQDDWMHVIEFEKVA